MVDTVVTTVSLLLSLFVVVVVVGSFCIGLVKKGSGVDGNDDDLIVMGGGGTVALFDFCWGKRLRWSNPFWCWLRILKFRYR